MRIGIDIVTTQNQDSHLGKGNYTLEMVRRFVEINREDEFFLFKYDAPSTLDRYLLQEGDSEGTNLGYKPIYPNVTYVNCGRFWEKGMFSSVWFDGIWFNLEFLPKIRSYDLDAFFSPMPFRGIPLKYTKVVTVVHDVIQLAMNRFSERGGLFDVVKRFEYMYDIENISKSDLIITDTDYSRQDLQHFGGIPQNKVKVVYLGVKEDLEPVETRPVRILESYNIPGPYMIYLGGVEHHKNVRKLIHAFKTLVTKHPEIPHHLVLAGGGFSEKNPRGSRYLDLVKKEGLSDRVIFPGYIEADDLRYLLGGADLYVTLSLYEGFGLPPIEAMKCKTAVLASDRSCHTEVLGEYAVYVDPDNNTEVVSKMYKVLTDEKLRKMISEEGYKYVQKYSWDKAAKETMQHILDTAK